MESRAIDNKVTSQTNPAQTGGKDKAPVIDAAKFHALIAGLLGGSGIDPALLTLDNIPKPAAAPVPEQKPQAPAKRAKKSNQEKEEVVTADGGADNKSSELHQEQKVAEEKCAADNTKKDDSANEEETVSTSPDGAKADSQADAQPEAQADTETDTQAAVVSDTEQAVVAVNLKNTTDAATVEAALAAAQTTAAQAPVTEVAEVEVVQEQPLAEKAAVVTPTAPVEDQVTTELAAEVVKDARAEVVASQAAQAVVEENPAQTAAATAATTTAAATVAKAAKDAVVENTLDNVTSDTGSRADSSEVTKTVASPMVDIKPQPVPTALAVNPSAVKEQADANLRLLSQRVLMAENFAGMGAAGKNSAAASAVSELANANSAAQQERLAQAKGKGTGGTANVRDPEKIVEQVKELMRRAVASRDGNQMVVRLNPEELGNLVVKVSQRDGQLYARIIPESHDVENMLRNRIHEVTQALAAAGIRGNQINISIGHELAESETFRFYDFAEGGNGHSAGQNSESGESTGQNGQAAGKDLASTGLMLKGGQDLNSLPLSGWVA